MIHTFFIDYDKNIKNNMLLLDVKYKDIITHNTKYNNDVLLCHNLPNEILMIILSYLSLFGLMSCKLVCSTFNQNVKKVLESGEIFVTKYDEFETALKLKNVKIIKYDNTKNYMINPSYNITYNSSHLKKIIIYANFPDQVQILKTFNCKKYFIDIITCHNIKNCYLCLVNEIYYEMKTICDNFMLYHKGKLYKIN
jgi:hypothetical protein